MTPAVIELSDVVKDYRGLRPLRLQHLAVRHGETIGIVGFDQPTAEVFVNLVTGATLPDSGEVRVFGRPTADVTDSAGWLALVDRFGIVSARAVLLGGLSVIQNLSMPFTLDIEPPPEDVRTRAGGLAAEVGLPESCWSRPVAELGPVDLVRVRVARALAHDPAVLLLEHTNAEVPESQATSLGGGIRDVAKKRNLAVVALTANDEFAVAVAGRVVTLNLATGHLKERRAGWFARRLG